MEDDRTPPRNSSPANSGESGDVDNQIDDLLPVPTHESDKGPGHVDGSMDTVLPAPGHESHPADDATTREELGVDTTVDGVDDFIDSSPSGQATSSDTPPGEVMEIAGEPIAWEPVAEPPTDGASSDGDVEPINYDSDFFASSYRREGEASAPGRPTAEPEHVPETAHQCTACGAETGTAPFCSQCGTDQYPQTRLSSLLSPLLAWSRPMVVRGVLTAAAALALIALLANSGASALIISALTIPVVLVMRLKMQLRLHTPSGWVQVAMMIFVGLAAGLPLAWFGARIVRRSWIETGVLNFGAAGFGGNFAESAGVAPFIVWLVVGLLLPIVILLGIGAIPAAMRMVLTSAPQESTGMLLSGALAAGYVMASAIIFYRPLYTELAPRMTTSQWTLTIFGLAVIRPLVWVLSGAMIGALVWRYVRTASSASIMIPAVIAITIPLGFNLVSIAASPGGYWLETIFGVVVAVVAVFFYARFLPAAQKNDATLVAEVSE